MYDKDILGKESYKQCYGKGEAWMSYKKSKVTKLLAMALIVSTTVYSSVTSSAATGYETKTSNVVGITEEGGWLESAYVEWSPVANATGYHVYYKAIGSTEYTRLDDQLVRFYKEYCRADVLGIKAGTYTIKIVPIINGQESVNYSETKVITVKEQVREGFAFSKNSTMGTGSGGYNDDGTVPEGAQILYLTKDTVNTVSLDVITNSKGQTTTCTGIVDILAKRQKGYDKTPLIIRIIGTIKASDITGLNTSGYLQLKGCYNVTVEGVGEDATINGWGLLIRNARNVEVRNLGIMLFPDDGISLDTDNENIWIHNNDIFYGTAGSDADQAKGDGSCDVKGYSTNVTISYNHFYDSGKSSLCGMSDSEEFFVTYHHNWFDHSDSRHPRIRVGTIHIYNNYFDGNSKYGVGVTKGSSAFVEANYFRNCKYPMLSSLQGTDIYGGNTGTFSGEAGGMIKSFNNIIVGEGRLVYANEDSKQFDAYLALSRDEKVPSSYTTVSGGTTYNNFDTNSTIMYEYTPTAPENVEEEVTYYSGRVNGGDISFEFQNSVDDTSYTVNTELMSVLRNYESSLVSVGGSSIPDEVTPTVEPTIEPTVAPTAEPTIEPTVAPTVEPTIEPTVAPTTEPTVAPTDSPSTPEESVTHNFTLQGKTSDFFNIVGNLSTTKGTVTYKDLSLTTCLKVETSTQISFTTTEASVLTMVFPTDCNKKIMVDGEEVTITNGIASVNLEAGPHSISKRDAILLYYLSVVIK